MHNSSKSCATKGRNITTTTNRELSEKSKRKRPSCLDKDFEYNFSDVSEDELNFELEPFGSYTVTEKIEKTSKPKVGKKRKSDTIEPVKIKVAATDKSKDANDKCTNGLVCDYCLSSDINRIGEKEVLLICKDCGAKAHPSCMDYTKDLAERAYRTDWQCIDCKTCCICQDPGDADAMLFCDACDKGYHMTCHQPALKEKPLGNWVCETCRAEIDKVSIDYINISQDSCDLKMSPSEDILVTSPNSSTNNSNDIYLENTEKSSDSDQNSEPKYSTNGFIKFFDCVTSKLPMLADTLPADPPDASKWSIEDVFHYFSDVGFGLHAAVFREQEIDGQSLLLMKRNDVITGLALRLGPALKIFAHVQRLQGRLEITS